MLSQYRTLLVSVCLAFASLTFASHAADENVVSGEQGTKYLVARSKALSYDFVGAAELFRELIRQSSKDLHLLATSLPIFIVEGDLESAMETASEIEELDEDDLLSDIVLLAADLSAGDYEKALIRSTSLEAFIGPDLPEVVRGWVYVGMNDMASAEDSFGTEIAQGAQELLSFHRALALATTGDFESAENLMGEIAGRDQVPRSIPDQLITAWAQALVQLDKRDEALQLMRSFGHERVPDHVAEGLNDLDRRIEAGDQVDFDFVTGPATGVAAFFLSVARDLAIDGDERLQAAIIFVRLAEILDPNNPIIAHTLGEYFGNLGSYESAIASLDTIDEKDPAHFLAEIEAAQWLRSSGQIDESFRRLDAVKSQYGDKVRVHLAIGNGRLNDNAYDLAEIAFDRAHQLTLARAPENPGDEQYQAYFEGNWYPLFSRAIARERLGEWERAKSDLELAAEYSGGHPYVMNYLGYSMLIQGEDSQLAEQYIAMAVAAEPDNGAFIDSLGWAYFLQGRYEEALPLLERAVRLLPNTAEVIDHLGDVYWKVGRKREAIFQWKRALLFEDEYVDADRVERKIDIGLDRVLEEEAAANDPN
ncbi:MAG: tetratricopeptide repeat protein [Rhodobacteraceae bacterium]|nr:tetratricopeptide repeat protein [Paracoccaceae bacterium]